MTKMRKFIKTWTKYGIGLMTMGVTAFGLASVASAQTEVMQYPAGDPTQIVWKAQDSGGVRELSQFPFAYSFDTVNPQGDTVRKVFVSWSASLDTSSTPPLYRYSVSDDGGVTYRKDSNGNQIVKEEGVTFTNSIKKRDGSIVSVDFVPVPSSTTSSDWDINYHTSTDNGETWTHHVTAGDIGKVTFPVNVDWFRLHRGIVENSDGSLLAVAYGNFNTDPTDTIEQQQGSSIVTGSTRRDRAMLIKSVDGGVNWSYVSTIAYDRNLYNSYKQTGVIDRYDRYEGFNETALARTKDGNLLAVLRTGSYISLYQSRSTDNGITWSAPQLLPGVTDFNDQQSVDPDLLLMPNGTLVLSYGRSYTKLLVSEDGNGNSWTAPPLITYNEIPGSNTKETSGYTAIVPVGPNRLQVYGDTGANWSYPASDPVNRFSIWSKYVDIANTSRFNKIDLKTMHKLGQIAVSTDMNYTDSAHPEARVSGAFDGSTDYWSSAFKSGTAGSFQIDLNRIYRITDLGISLKNGSPQSASIYFSIDGTNWGQAVKSYSNAKHYALDYTRFNVPISARYVKVVATGTDGMVSLNEIELYTDEDTFENHPTPKAPTGYQNARMAWVSEGDAFESKRSLIISDTSNTQIAEIFKYGVETATKSLSFRVNPKTITSAFMFDIKGVVTSGTTSVFHLAVFPDGSIKYYNGSSWVSVSAAGTVPMNSWSLIRVDATKTSANLYVNNTLAGTASPYANPANVESLNGFSFSSGGTVPVGDSVYVDDVLFQEYASAYYSFESDTAGSAPQGFVAGSTMATVSAAKAYAGTKSLRIFDNSASAIAKIEKAANASDYKALEFRAFLEAVPSAFIMNIMGEVTAGSDTIYHLAIFPDGSVKYYNGSSWIQIAGAGTVSNFHSWNLIRVEANKTAANLYINNNWIGTAGMQVTPSSVQSLTGFQYTSGGTVPAGDDVYVDNLYYGP